MYTESNVQSQTDTRTRTVNGIISTAVDASNLKCTVTATDASDSTKTSSMQSAPYNVKKAVTCWGSAVYVSSDNSCHCTLVEQTNKIIVNDSMGCEYQDVKCTQPTLKPNEIWQGSPICAKVCASGYSYNILGDCVSGGEGKCTNICATPTPIQYSYPDCSCHGTTPPPNVTCSFPYVSVSTTTVTQSPYALIPVVGPILFPPSTSTTMSCMLDTMSGLVICMGGIIILVVVVGAAFVGYGMSKKRR
jgi:hypothetical protein